LPLQSISRKTLPEALPNLPMTFYTDSFPLHHIITLAPGKPTRGGFMHRSRSGIPLALAIILVVSLTGCLGKSSSAPANGGVQTVTLSPSAITSIDVGGTLNFSATAKNSAGGAVLGVNIQFVVSVPQGSTGPAPLSVNNSGSACGGTWDVTGTMCSPGGSGIALVQAVTNGISSAPTTVYVHSHIDSLQVSRLDPEGPPLYDCFSQGQTWNYAATAYSGTTDITNTVGPITWSSSNAGVVTAVPIVSQTQPNLLNQVQVTAKAPGITNLFASVSGANSSAYPFTTCLIQAVYLQIGGQSQSGNSITVANGATVSVTATAIDSLYKFTGTPITNPPLTWSTTNPEVIAFGTATNSTGGNTATARNNLGGATLFASCTPPTCNIGVLPALPVYASDGILPNGLTGYGSISVNVSANKPPTYTAWVATTGCQLQALGCTSVMFPVTPGTTPIGKILTVPRTPNSMMFNHLSAARVYLGSDQGLMFADLTASTPTVSLVSNSSTPCNVALCGKLLTISNDGKLVVVSDTVSTPSQVYLYTGSSSSPISITIPGETATAAAFSPDQLKLFIVTDAGNLYVYSTVDAVRSLALAAPATQLAFSADGSFAYVVGSPAGSVSAYSTCSLPLPGPASVDIGSIATTNSPLAIFPSPVLEAGPLGLTQNIFALEPPPPGGVNTAIEVLTANQFTQVPIPYESPIPQFTCNPPTLQSFTKSPPISLGQGNINPLYAQLVADGTEMIIVSGNIPAVLVFNVSNETTSYIPLYDPLGGTSTPLAASASTDGSQVYVAACDQYPNGDPTQPCSAGSVHIVGTVSIGTIQSGDYQQVPYVNINDGNDMNMCNSQGGSNPPLCLPNLIAIKPQ